MSVSSDMLRAGDLVQILDSGRWIKAILTEEKKDLGRWKVQLDGCDEFMMKKLIHIRLDGHRIQENPNFKDQTSKQADAVSDTSNYNFDNQIISPISTPLLLVNNVPCIRCYGRGFFHYSKMKHDLPTEQKCFFCKSCLTCGGSGQLSKTHDFVSCSRCKSAGWIHSSTKHPHSADAGEPCLFCADCIACKSSGFVQASYIPDHMDASQVTCKKCKGRTWYHDSPLQHNKLETEKCFFCKDCEVCGGSGLLLKTHDEIECISCDGCGWVHTGKSRHESGANYRCELCSDCNMCDGSGLLPDENTNNQRSQSDIAPCFVCKGRGWKHYGSKEHTRSETERCDECKDCYTCEGSGILLSDASQCHLCSGHGWIHENTDFQHKGTSESRCVFCNDCALCSGRGITKSMSDFSKVSMTFNRHENCTSCFGQGWLHALDSMPHDKGPDEMCFFCQYCPDCNGGPSQLSIEISEKLRDVSSSRKIVTWLSRYFVLFLLLILTSTIVFPLLTRDLDLLPSGECRYPLTPYTIIIIGCIGNLMFQVLSLFPEDVLQVVFKQKPTNVTDLRPSTLIIQLSLLLLNVLIFCTQQYEDLSTLMGSTGKSWGTYQCYCLILFNSPNFRNSFFSVIFVPLKILHMENIHTQEGLQRFSKAARKRLQWKPEKLKSRDRRHCLNISVEKFLIWWNIISCLLYTISCAPPILTHFLPSLVLFFWFPLMVLLALMTPSTLLFFYIVRLNAMDENLMIVLNLRNRLIGCIVAFMFIIIFIIFISMQQVMISQFYNKMPYGSAISHAWESRHMKKFLDDMKHDILLLIRAIM